VTENVQYHITLIYQTCCTDCYRQIGTDICIYLCSSRPFMLVPTIS